MNLGAATRRLQKTLQAGLDAGKDARSIAQDLVAEGKAIDDEDVLRNKEMSKWGGEWLVERRKSAGSAGEALKVMTVCNTGSLATSVCKHSLEARKMLTSPSRGMELRLDLSPTSMRQIS